MVDTMDQYTKKYIGRANFDFEYYRNKYFLFKFKNKEQALKHWEAEGFRKHFLVSICDELKTHDNPLCKCKILNDFSDDIITSSIDTEIVKVLIFLDYIISYLEILSEYIKRCVNSLIVLNSPVLPKLVYTSTIKTIMINLREYEQAVINAKYNNIGIFYHPANKNKKKIKYVLSEYEKISTSIELPHIDLKKIGLDNYSKRLLEYDDKMTYYTNPFPSLGFDYKPSYYNELDDFLKSNWKFNTHIKRFTHALDCIGLEIDKINVYKKSIETKKKLFNIKKLFASYSKDEKCREKI